MTWSCLLFFCQPNMLCRWLVNERPKRSEVLLAELADASCAASADCLTRQTTRTIISIKSFFIFGGLLDLFQEPEEEEHFAYRNWATAWFQCNVGMSGCCCTVPGRCTWWASKGTIRIAMVRLLCFMEYSSSCEPQGCSKPIPGIENQWGISGAFLSHRATPNYIIHFRFRFSLTKTI